MKDSADGDAGACEGNGLGVNREMNTVDEDPKVRDGTISAACPPSDYTIWVSISSPDDVELASASESFSVAVPGPDDEPLPENPPGVPDAPTGTVTAPGQVALDWNDVAGADSYDVRYYDND